MAKDKFYFQHDSNSHNDLKILSLRNTMGWAGYGLYWAILEILRDQENYKIPSQAQATLKLALSLDQATLDDFISNCLTIGLLVEKDGFLYSESFLRRMLEIDEKRGRLREFGRRGGLISSQAQARLKPPSSSKVKQSKVKQTNSMGFDFEFIWDKYPRREGRKEALRHFEASVKSDKDFEDINKALENYLQTDAVKRGFIKMGSTWFNNWRDYIDFSGVSLKSRAMIEMERMIEK